MSRYLEFTRFTFRRCFSSSTNNNNRKLMCALDAIDRFVPKKDARIHVHMAGATPNVLLSALAQHAKLKTDDAIQRCKTYHMSLEGRADHMHPDCSGKIRAQQFFAGSNGRSALLRGDSDYIPMPISELPLFYDRAPPDVSFLHVTPPDKDGMCGLGVSVTADLFAASRAKHVIAQMNPNMPRIPGHGFIHISKLSAIVETDEQLPEVHYPEADVVDTVIGKHVASLIPDNACLQLGIGSMPNAVLSNLVNHVNLGVHTEMFSDGVLSLVKAGVITNSKKKLHTGKFVATFLMGSKNLYKWLNNNQEVLLLDVLSVNNPGPISSNDNVHAVNSAIEIDLSGQIVADSIGPRIYSGCGGQMDFMKGASLSAGGKAIIALPSVTSKGESRISAIIKEGGGVVSPRAHAKYIVTEHGIVDLFGKNLAERARLLTSIAHPSHRQALEEECRRRFGKTIF